MDSAAVIREVRLAAGLTQAALARRLGTRQSAVARWESGTLSPRVSTLERILRACGAEPRLVVERADASDRDQIVERLGWTPRERLDYLLDMLAFERRARRAKARRSD